jgi:hypothetical protein
MSSNCYVTGVVYLVIVFKLVVGLTNLLYALSGHLEVNTFLLLVSVISISQGCLLLYGVIKRNASYVLAYLVLWGLSLIIGIIAMFGVLISLSGHDGDSPDQNSPPGAIIVFVVASLAIICALQYCVYLYYKDLKEDTKVSNVVYICREVRLEVDPSEKSHEEPIANYTKLN